MSTDSRHNSRAYNTCLVKSARMGCICPRHVCVPCCNIRLYVLSEWLAGPRGSEKGGSSEHNHPGMFYDFWNMLQLNKMFSKRSGMHWCICLGIILNDVLAKAMF